jgi:CRISPR/Cas system-associated exonuclease Cas4 (RecB family)
MILTVDQIMDYIKCPMLYKYRYENHLNLYTEEELFKIAIQKVIDQMYYSLMDKNLMSKADVKYKWGDSWNLEVDRHKIMWMPSASRRRHQMNGLEILLKIHGYLSSINPHPISIDDVFGIQLGENRIETDMRYIHGDDGMMTLVEYVINDYIPDETTLVNHMPITAKAMIFEDVFNTRVKNLVYYSTKNAASYQTFRNKSDYKELKDTVGMIAHCVDNKIFYKQYADTCKTCMYKIYCNR